MVSTAVFHSLSASDYDPTGGKYRRRKVANISLSGCQACKQKKVKCDEAHPICLRCYRNKRECLYTPKSANCQKQPSYALVPQIFHQPPPSLGLVITPPMPNSKNGTSSMHLLHHLQVNWKSIFPVPESLEILHLSKTDPLIRNVALAVAACHLRTVAGGRSHQLAESFHTYTAIENYRSSLLVPYDQMQDTDIRTLLLVATLLNLNAFALTSAEVPDDGVIKVEDSWVFSTENNHLGWMSLQTGMRPLMILMASSQRRITEYLTTIFIGSSSAYDSLRHINRSGESLPDHWKEAFDLDGTSTSSHATPNANSNCDLTDVYRGPATILANVRHIEPVITNSFYFVAFLSKIDTRFLSLLYGKDPRALWLVGYWMGLMARFKGLWWCEQRAKRDYQAICIWLQTRSPNESDLWRALMVELLKLDK